MCPFQSQGVSKILRACRNFGKVNGLGQQIAMIHSFPTMYILGGVGVGLDMVEMGQIKVFVQELGLKQGVLADTNIDYLTSE